MTVISQAVDYMVSTFIGGSEDISAQQKGGWEILHSPEILALRPAFVLQFPH